MTDYTKAKSAAGFTLIEVVVALAILSWVLGSTLYVVQQYADERLKLRQGFFRYPDLLEPFAGALSRRSGLGADHRSQHQANQRRRQAKRAVMALGNEN